MLNHIGRFESPEVIHTDQGPAFHNELVYELFDCKEFNILLPYRTQSSRMLS